MYALGRWTERTFWVRVHRYAGLLIALFLTIAGLTGSLLAFGPELDVWLNPHLFKSKTRGAQLPFDDLVISLESYDPVLQVNYLSVDTTPGNAALALVSRRADASRDLPLTYDQVFVDPVSGTVLGTRKRGACCFETENLYHFVLNIHHTLYLPDMWGRWFMGGISLIWLFDCFVGLGLTLPRSRPFWSKWKPAWLVKRGADSYRVNLDLHRAGGLWLWGILLALAASSIALNLRDEVFRPVVSLFSPLTSTPSRPSLPSQTGRPPLSFEEVRRLADKEALRREWECCTSGVAYLRSARMYLAFLRPSHYDRGAGLGFPLLYYDAYTGALIDTVVPSIGSSGDIFVQMQFPLHSGQIAGLPGRIAICISGLMVAMLSITGIVIWYKKTRARLRASLRSMNAATSQ